MSDFEPTNADGTPVPPAPVGPVPAWPAPVGPVPGAAKTAGNGQRIALTVALAVVLVAGGGLSWVAFGHTDAKPKPWTAPAAKHAGSYGTASGGVHYGKIGKLLLPQPRGYEPGPDDGAFGNDTELSSAQAISQFKSQYGDMTSAQRRAVDKAVGKLGIKGMGMRSFQNEDTDKTVLIELTQINKQYAKDTTQAMTELFNDLFDKGPKVPGHPEAHCYVESLANKGAVQELDCLADEGDLMVTFTAQGTKPVADEEVLTILKDQLDRIADPGESV